jgi:alcohol dehydrogenase
MKVEEYQCLRVSESSDGSFSQTVETRPLEALPDGDLTIRVQYSSLNYKDALSATGNRGVTKEYPHTPGIDAAGVVESSATDRFRPGDEVIVTGFDLGMNTDGGFAERIRVPVQWALPLPSGMTLGTSMSYGTAGLTAGLCVRAVMEGGVTADKGTILVTGATGGVGSLSVAILSHLGYHVTAVTGKRDRHDFLTGAGASEVMDREEFLRQPERPLLKSLCAGAIDTLGGKPLDILLRGCDEFGVVAACGMAASTGIETNVFPFILRGVRLDGITSQNCPMEIRESVWARLAGEWHPPILETLTKECSLGELPDHIQSMLQVESTGRIRVRCATA